MDRISPLAAIAAATGMFGGAAASDRRVSPERVERDRAALRTQLAALEDYHGIGTSELLAGRAEQALPAGLPHEEAARWAELHATLRRLDDRVPEDHASAERGPRVGGNPPTLRVLEAA